MTEEEQLIDAFFLPRKKQRYKGFVQGARTRPKFLAELGHFTELGGRFKHDIPGPQQTLRELHTS